MPPRRFPPVTLERLLRWTTANEVPEGALVYDDQGRMIDAVRYDKPVKRVWLETAYADRTERKPFTLKRLLEAAEEMQVPPEAEFWHDGQRVFNDVPVIDLGDGEIDGFDVTAATPAGHYLFLQRRWG